MDIVRSVNRSSIMTVISAYIDLHVFIRGKCPGGNCPGGSCPNTERNSSIFLDNYSLRN